VQVQFSDGSSAEGDLVVYDIFTFLFMTNLPVRIHIYMQVQLSDGSSAEGVLLVGADGKHDFVCISIDVHVYTYIYRCSFRMDRVLRVIWWWELTGQIRL